MTSKVHNPETKQLLAPSELAKPLDRANLGNDQHALRELVGFLNNNSVTGAVVPPEAKQEIAAVLSPSSTALIAPIPTASLSPPPEQSVPNTPAQLGRKIFFTGRMFSGKDFVASHIGADIFGFADPIYALTEYLHGVKVNSKEGKDHHPGIRQFMQSVGQWGRNEINSQYPLNAERAMFCMMIRSLANQNCLMPGVEWGQFGLTPDLWIDGLLARVAATEQQQQTVYRRYAVTNCRFPNEYKSLTAEGWQHWHVVCSPQTWLARLSKNGLDAKSPVISDISEKLAADLNADLIKKLSTHKQGNKMRVIWSDELVPPPSNRIYTIGEFKALL
jgi:hypothetical protein